MSKKRNPQDSTRRNVQAGAKRDSAILVRLKALEHRVSDLETFISNGEWTIDKMLKAGWRPFAEQQRQMGYRHSTSAPHTIRVK